MVSLDILKSRVSQRCHTTKSLAFAEASTTGKNSEYWLRLHPVQECAGAGLLTLVDSCRLLLTFLPTLSLLSIIINHYQSLSITIIKNVWADSLLMNYISFPSGGCMGAYPSAKFLGYEHQVPKMNRGNPVSKTATSCQKTSFWTFW